MTYEVYRYIFLGGAILAAIMLVVSVIVFFLLNIPNVIGNLTGANARKGIENIRNNGKNNNKSSELHRGNMSREKLTDKISYSGKIVKDDSPAQFGEFRTEKISTQQLDFGSFSNETVVLNEAVNSNSDTTVLAENNAIFTVEYEITYIHTDEIIA